jgi:hypothetical protein
MSFEIVRLGTINRPQQLMYHDAPCKASSHPRAFQQNRLVELVLIGREIRHVLVLPRALRAFET